nr:CopG family transcriptional regulator [Schaalia odontolytica]
MSDRLLHGEPVSDEQIQAWADEAERGYDLTKLAPPLLGRPLVGNGPGAAITVRSDEQPLDAMKQRASSEGE